MGGGLVVSCLPSVASKWIGRQLYHWQANHPGAPIHVIGSELEECADKQIDFRITYGENVRAFDHYVELFTDWAVPACAPSLLRDYPVNSPRDILTAPLLGIKWGPKQSSLASWDHWAANMEISDVDMTPALTFSLSASAIDAAIDGRGFVLGQLSMISEDVASGRLVIPIDRRIKMLAPYFLAWDRAALEKPLGPVFRAWVIAIAKRQAIVSAPPN
jgi:LysR family glycine cleavage system transcriptional activator